MQLPKSWNAFIGPRVRNLVKIKNREKNQAKRTVPGPLAGGRVSPSYYSSKRSKSKTAIPSLLSLRPVSCSVSLFIFSFLLSLDSHLTWTMRFSASFFDRASKALHRSPAFSKLVVVVAVRFFGSSFCLSCLSLFRSFYAS